MASYTLSLYSLENAKTFKLFNENYDFYLEENKVNFEKKFFNRYFDREIYCKNPYVFRRALLGKLNEIMPYYKQIYQTELEAKKINFLLNKDLKEEFIRDIENSAQGSATSTGTTTGDSTTIFSDTPEGQISNIEKFMSNGTINKANDSSENNTSSNSTGKTIEKTSFLSQGNIGVTSSAELLDKWRQIIINIDQLILNELENLFLDIY